MIFENTFGGKLLVKRSQCLSIFTNSSFVIFSCLTKQIHPLKNC